MSTPTQQLKAEVSLAGTLYERELGSIKGKKINFWPFMLPISLEDLLNILSFEFRDLEHLEHFEIEIETLGLGGVSLYICEGFEYPKPEYTKKTDPKTGKKLSFWPGVLPTSFDKIINTLNLEFREPDYDEIKIGTMAPCGITIYKDPDET